MNSEQTAAASRFIGTANRGFAQQAQEEVRRLIPGVKFVYLAVGEIFLMELPHSTVESVRILRTNEPIFLRHIQPIDTYIPITRTTEDLKLIQNYIEHLTMFHPGDKATVQIRRMPDVSFAYSTYDIKELVISQLKEVHHVETTARHADKIISIYLTDDQVYLGISHPLDNLSDWSGGAVRYKKETNQISRAKFKLLEAEETFGLDFTQYSNALDIGAAPGGWTSLLLERGLKVTAIDPAELHSSLLQHSKLTYLQQNASAASFSVNEFDLLVCDMSWSPRQMSKLVEDLIYALQSQGTAIITAKLMHKKSFQTVREICKFLEPKLELIRAKQLFHNREELTLFLRKQ